MDFSAEYEFGIKELGLLPADFWRLTPAEIATMAQGHNRKSRRRVNELIYSAWHTAVFGRMEKMPALEDVIKDEGEAPQRHREQTDDEMMAMARILNAAFGGEVVEA